jgi:hypothetical protein
MIHDADGDEFLDDGGEVAAVDGRDDDIMVLVDDVEDPRLW